MSRFFTLPNFKLVIDLTQVFAVGPLSSTESYAMYTVFKAADSKPFTLDLMRTRASAAGFEPVVWREDHAQWDKLVQKLSEDREALLAAWTAQNQ